MRADGGLCLQLHAGAQRTQSMEHNSMLDELALLFFPRKTVTPLQRVERGCGQRKGEGESAEMQ